MRRLLVSLAGLVLAVTASADVPKGIYRGSSQTTAKFLDPVTLAVKSTRRYSRKLTVTIAKRLTFGNSTEANPFYFAIAPTNTSPLTAGDFFTASARTAAVNGQTTLLQYWLMQNTQSGFTGTFGNAHQLERAQQDRLIVPFKTPDGTLKAHRLYDGGFGSIYQVAATGLVTGTSMALAISGYARAGKLGDVGNNAIVTFQTSITAKKK